MCDLGVEYLKHLNIDQAVIDADAAAILHSATQAVGKILARRQEMDAQGLKDKPLVVLAGENHVLPSHKLHHLLVLRDLKKAESDTVLTYELEHNFDRSFRSRIKNDFSSMSVSEKSAWHLNVFLHFSVSSFADMSDKALFNFIKKEKILFQPTDASSCRGFLNLDDPSTRASFEACEIMKSGVRDSFNYNSFVSNVLPQGMFIRNHHMAEHSLAFAEDTKARILFQHCGNDHIDAENPSNQSPEEERLTSLFRRKGATVLTVGYSPRVDHNIACLPPKRARYDVANTLFTSRVEERIYVDAVLEKAGVGEYCYNDKAIWETKNSIYQMMNP